MKLTHDAICATEVPYTYQVSTDVFIQYTVMHNTIISFRGY
jgi:hypothetical protein